MTQKVFCKLHNLKHPTFSYWLRKSTKEVPQAGGFVEIKREASSPVSLFEIHVGPARIKFDSSVRREEVYNFLIQLKAHA